MKSWIKKPEGLPSFYLLSSPSKAEMRLKLKRSRFGRQRQIAFDAEDTPSADGEALAPSSDHPPPSAPSTPPGPLVPPSTPIHQPTDAPATPIPNCKVPFWAKMLLLMGLLFVVTILVLGNILPPGEKSAGQNSTTISTEPTPHRTTSHRHRHHPKKAQPGLRSEFPVKKAHKPH